MPSDKFNRKDAGLSELTDTIRAQLVVQNNTSSAILELIREKGRAIDAQYLRALVDPPIAATTIKEFIQEVLPHETDRNLAASVFTPAAGFYILSDLKYINAAFVKENKFSFAAGERLLRAVQQIPSH